MKQINKYILNLEYHQTLVIPCDRILSVMRQGDNIVVYAIHDARLPKREFDITTYGTGHKIPEEAGCFLGTVNMDEFVWHVFVDEGMGV